MTKKLLTVVLLLLLLFLLYGYLKTDSSHVSQKTTESGRIATAEEETEEDYLLKIEVNGHTLLADFEDNSSSDALKDKLREKPLTLTMSDYGNFEKVADLPFELPRNDKRITTKPGDVILYQGNSLTIYYGKNTWEFTKLARIRDTDKNLKEILGDGDVSISFSLYEE